LQTQSRNFVDKEYTTYRKENLTHSAALRATCLSLNVSSHHTTPQIPTITTIIKCLQFLLMETSFFLVVSVFILWSCMCATVSHSNGSFFLSSYVYIMNANTRNNSEIRNRFPQYVACALHGCEQFLLSARRLSKSTGARGLVTL
jgi:hypothetical protein